MKLIQSVKKIISFLLLIVFWDYHVKSKKDPGSGAMSTLNELYNFLWNFCLILASLYLFVCFICSNFGFCFCMILFETEKKVQFGKIGVENVGGGGE